MRSSIRLRLGSVATTVLLLFIGACGSDAGPGATSRASQRPAAIEKDATPGPTDTGSDGETTQPTSTPVTRETCAQLRRDWMAALRDGELRRDLVREYEDGGCEEKCGPFLDQEGDARDYSCPD